MATNGTMTHYVPAFTRVHGFMYQAFCGAFVPMREHRAEPSCAECARILAHDSADFESMEAWSKGLDDA